MASAFLELQLSAALGGGLVLQLYYFQCNEWAMAAEIFSYSAGRKQDCTVWTKPYWRAMCSMILLVI